MEDAGIRALAKSKKGFSSSVDGGREGGIGVFAVLDGGFLRKRDRRLGGREISGWMIRLVFGMLRGVVVYRFQSFVYWDLLAISSKHACFRKADPPPHDPLPHDPLPTC